MTDSKKPHPGRLGPHPQLGSSSAPLGSEAVPDTAEFMKGRPTLDSHGRISGVVPRVESPDAPVPLNAPLDEPLELAEREAPRVEPRIEKFRDDEPLPYRGMRWWAAGITALCVGLGALTMLLGPTVVGVDRAAPGQVLFMSTPLGAVVRIEAHEIGSTPVAVDNRWKGPTGFDMSLPGYITAVGSFEGGETATLHMELVKLGAAGAASVIDGGVAPTDSPDASLDDAKVRP